MAQRRKMTENQNEEKNDNQSKHSNFLKYASNPKAFTLKRWMLELLGNKYPEYNDIVERISSALATEKDLKDFGSLVTQIYETAYYKAVSDYKEQAEKMGMKIKVVPSSDVN